MTDVQQEPAVKTVPVTLEVVHTIEVPAGPTPVPKLKEELGVQPDVVLWRETSEGHRIPLDDDDIVEVREGERFEAIPPGGVS